MLKKEDKMEVGDKVIVNAGNTSLREKFYWQPFEIREIRQQATGTIVRLRGLCLPNIEIIGDSIKSLTLYK